MRSLSSNLTLSYRQRRSQAAGLGGWILLRGGEVPILLGRRVKISEDSEEEDVREEDVISAEDDISEEDDVSEENDICEEDGISEEEKFQD
ncbi:hypothetical protein AVEN_210324-1 [Araneus ventricosus]|uniref:Uncharacterized protein n=1 Tax=Araneus ventricosus TaxID=182803 RepID=A0A4Y2LYN3_ARAVE|nr:hypothetical protein AVEN_210324-1 [Araneus ventricosus]